VTVDLGMAADLLRLGSQLVDGIQRGMVERGFDDVRPAHGFAFSLISSTRATTSDVAAHLGITKQAGTQLVDHLERSGYLRREPDPRDGRAKLLVLTERGWACTRAADEAASAVVQGWRSSLSPELFDGLREALTRLAPPGPLRPAW
jgi:DNA-binding MarR family transcriptional regulator